MFALTVEQLSRYEYKSKKADKGKKRVERKDLSRAVDEQSLCVNSDAPTAYRSPIMARRKMRLMQMTAGPRSASPHRASLANSLASMSIDSSSKSMKKSS